LCELRFSFAFGTRANRQTFLEEAKIFFFYSKTFGSDEDGPFVREWNENVENCTSKRASERAMNEWIDEKIRVLKFQDFLDFFIFHFFASKNLWAK
jgi:hypothetical protein